MANFGQAWAAAADAAGRAQQRQLWQGMGAWERHKRLMHDLATLYRGAGGGGGGGAAGAGGVGGGAGAALAAQQLPEKSDYDILRDHHRFIRTEQDDARDSWEVGAATCPPPIVFRGGCCHLPAAPSPCKAAPPPRVPSSPPLHLQVRLARRYYSKLFKEYAVADLSRHKEGRVGLRWRTQVRWGRRGAAAAGGLGGRVELRGAGMEWQWLRWGVFAPSVAGIGRALVVALCRPLLMPEQAAAGPCVGTTMHR